VRLKETVSMLAPFQQAVNEIYFKVFNFEVLCCQPEPAEGGFIQVFPVRQAHPDNLK
jgi:hypothetical protein